METLANGQLKETGRKVQNAANEIKKNASTAAANATGTGEDAMSRFQDVASSVQEAVEARIGQFGETAVQARSTAETYVKRNPLGWVLAAALVGIGLGFLVSFLRPSKR